MSPTNVDSMSRAGPAHRAQASGLVQTLRQVGGTLGIAVIGAATLAAEPRIGVAAGTAVGWAISGVALAAAFVVAWRGLEPGRPVH